MAGTDEQKQEWLALAAENPAASIGQGGRCPICDNTFTAEDPVRAIYPEGPTFNTPAGMNWICGNCSPSTRHN